MSFNATNQPLGNGGNDFKYEPLEEGTYPARLVGVANVGKHSASFKGEVKEPKDNIALTYELLDEFLKDENAIEKSNIILRLNTNKIITYANEEFYKISGFTKKELS